MLPEHDDSPSAAPQEVSAPQGTSDICLTSSGTFSINPRGCYIYTSKSFPVTVGPSLEPQPLLLTATGAYVHGQVKITSSIPSSTGGVLEAITVLAEPGGGVVTAIQVNPETDPGVYTYTLPADLGSSVTVTPVQPEGSLLLFKPESVTYQLAAAPAKGCPDAVAPIAAYQGVVVAGSTEPPVPGEDFTMTTKGGGFLARVEGLKGILTGGGHGSAGSMVWWLATQRRLWQVSMVEAAEHPRSRLAPLSCLHMGKTHCTYGPACSPVPSIQSSIIGCNKRLLFGLHTSHTCTQYADCFSPTHPTIHSAAGAVAHTSCTASHQFTQTPDTLHICLSQLATNTLP